MAPRQQSAMSWMVDSIEAVQGLAKDPKQARWFAPVLLVIDAVLCALIIKTVNYTEIDWTTYMQQIQKYVDGERNYSKIYGDTGPLVYPAIHVYIYRMLYSITNAGTNIVLAQSYFAVLYLLNLGIVMACYRMANVPPYVYPMLILSKRLHSIYLLRCFNDCWAAGALFLAIYFFQKRHWGYGAVAFSAGIGIKMTVLLGLPAVLLLLYQAKNRTDFITVVMYMGQVQFISSLPFTSHDARAYVSRAFQLTRAFRYEWTVNWKFLSEETFLSTRFSNTLLAVHAGFLLLFTLTRWTQPLGRSPRDLARLAFSSPTPAAQKTILHALNADFVMTTILTAMMIGMMCARSLHYQFFAYIAWATPFLLWKAKLHPVLMWVIWAGQEAAWNVFPAQDMTSKIVVGTLAATVVNVWVATGEDVPENVEQMAERVLVETGGPISTISETTAIPEVDVEPTPAKSRKGKKVRIAETS